MTVSLDLGGSVYLGGMPKKIKTERRDPRRKVPSSDSAHEKFPRKGSAAHIE